MTAVNPLSPMAHQPPQARYTRVSTMPAMFAPRALYAAPSGSLGL